VSSSLLLIELGGVIIGLAILARVAGRFGFSPIPLYLVAGLAFGEGGILPLVTAEDFIEVGAEIGVVLLLLMLGLEYSANELVQTLRRRAGDGLVDLALNFAPGFGAGIILGWGSVGAALLGGVTYVSSSGVVAKLVNDLGWVGNRETPSVLSLLVIEDMVMALYLPLVAVLLLGGAGEGAAVTVLAAVATVSFVLILAVPLGPRLSALVFSRSEEGLLLSILGATLLVAGVTERFRVSAAVGAFLVGIGLSGPAADRAHSLLSPLRDLFGAVFFVFFGLRTDPSSVPPVLGVAASLAAVGAATKLLTGWWTGAQAGVGRRARLRAGVALMARGEFSIAIAALGAEAGADPQLVPLTAAYVLILAVAGPLLALLLGRGSRVGRQAAGVAAP
jgi:CPA2 family monovalent cation:H+ antiporter-2